jgi:hypothetical protein
MALIGTDRQGDRKTPNLIPYPSISLAVRPLTLLGFGYRQASAQKQQNDRRPPNSLTLSHPIALPLPAEGDHLDRRLGGDRAGGKVGAAPWRLIPLPPRVR